MSSYFFDEKPATKARVKITNIKLGRVTFGIGDTVILKRHPREGKTKIVNFCTDVLGGVELQDKMEGFRSWNITDLKKISGVRAK